MKQIEESFKKLRAAKIDLIAVHNLRDHTPYKHGQVDDYQFGGGAGMVMMPEPLAPLSTPGDPHR